MTLCKRKQTLINICAGVFLMFVLFQAHIIYKQSYPKNEHKMFNLQHGDHIVEKINTKATANTMKRAIGLEEYRAGGLTGNPLIDLYGKYDPRHAGENGTGVIITDDQRNSMKSVLKQFRLNTLVSDMIPLNRMVPDSRLSGCELLSYKTSGLPTASVIIPFYDEWPSVLLRTVYSIVNRTPRRLIADIILVDDNSTLDELKGPLDTYLARHFPRGLVKLIRRPQRKGLASARNEGAKLATGDVLVFFDSHMEVNFDWLQPLLTSIVGDRRVVAMSMLDYIKWETFKYHFDRDWMVKYGWDWSMTFFETFFRPDEIGDEDTDPRPGSTMVGAAFAIDKSFFFTLGGYDADMAIWGGENLEMTWRVAMCGGKLVHLPCSKIGHVARTQPYSFPGGRNYLEDFNWKRAVSVWMGNYSRFVYSVRPSMKSVDVGDISQRLALKDKLKCKDFRWYLDHVWRELAIYDEDVYEWGQVKNEATQTCLDNKNHLFQARVPLNLRPCEDDLKKQGFSLKKSGRFQTSLNCVIAAQSSTEVALEDCLIGPKDTWYYDGSHLVHLSTQLCLAGKNGAPIVAPCDKNSSAQRWKFKPFQFS